MTPEEVRAHKARLKAESRKRLSDAQRKADDAARKRYARENTTNEQRAANASRMRDDRENTNDEQRAVNAARMRYNRENTTEEQRAANAARMRDGRTNETPVEAAKRLLDLRKKRTPIVKLYSAACRRRHIQSNGTFLPCAAHSAGHYPKYKSHGIVTAKKGSHCNAYLFRDEDSNECCGYGKVKIKPFTNWDEIIVNDKDQRVAKYPGLQFIKYLLESNSVNPEQKNFQANIVKYNTVHSFGSLSTHTLPHLPGGMPSVRMNGEITAQIGNLMPGNIPGTEQPYTPLHLQLYFCHNITTATALRCQNPIGTKLLPGLCKQIAQTLHDCNPFAKYLQSLQEQFDDAVAGIHPTLPPPQYWILSILDHRLNEDEMFALFDSRSNDPPDPSHTGIWIKSKGNAMKRLDMHNGCVPWLTFPLIFPCADQGWHMGIPINCDEVHSDGEESLTDMPNDEASILDRLASANHAPSWLSLTITEAILQSPHQAMRQLPKEPTW